ncbi:MAG TPA: hypothetical protein VM870_10930 [Pyrinomonadaceae bacterium]|nr:hypothetical protein [Pyrinomonadaceae bacterium]
MLEVLVASAMLFLVALAVCQTFATSAHLLLLAEAQRNAEAQVGEVINELSAQPADELIVGGSITVAAANAGRDDAALTNENCGAGPVYCDRLIVPDPARSEEPELPPNCSRWPCLWRTVNLTEPVPPGTAALFTRGWRVNERDPQRATASVTVAVFAHNPNGERGVLLALRTTNLLPH